MVKFYLRTPVDAHEKKLCNYLEAGLVSIKAIIWDVGQVLYITDDNDLYETLSKKTGIPYEKIREVYFSEMNDLIDVGKVTEEEFAAYAMEALDISTEKYDEYRQTREDSLYLDKQLMERIGELRKSYKMGLLSNFTPDLRHKIEHVWKNSDQFDEIVISCEVGLLKPDAAIFELVLERLGIQANEAVFVDDRVVNIEGAQKVGMHTVLFEHREQGLQALEDILAAQS
jgi:epoxide hydrolase-like predicted phosphatase